MSLRLNAVRLYLPKFLKKKHFRRLVLLTAEAFGTEAPPLEGRSHDARLRLFVSFTRDNALKTLSAGNAAAAGEGLYRGARAFGEDLRKALGLRTMTEAMAAARVLYREIGIDLRGNPDGTIVVASCRFAAEYTPEICGLISALDRGILTGLAGGGDLRFSRRLTEGHGSCRAFLGPDREGD